MTSSSKYCLRVYNHQKIAKTHHRDALHRLEIDEVLAAKLALVPRAAPRVEHAKQRDVIAESMHEVPFPRHHFVAFLHRRAKDRSLR